MGNAYGNTRDVLLGNISTQLMTICLSFKVKTLLKKETIRLRTYNHNHDPVVT